MRMVLPVLWSIGVFCVLSPTFYGLVRLSFIFKPYTEVGKIVAMYGCQFVALFLSIGIGFIISQEQSKSRRR